MEKRQDFKLTTNLSKVGYSSKDDCTAAIMNNRQYLKENNLETMRFKEQELTVDEFVGKIINGYSFCALYSYEVGKKVYINSNVRPYYTEPTEKDGYMKRCIKRTDYWKSTQIVSVDIDETNYKDIEKYLTHLTYQPTFTYTTFSDKQKNNGMRRFRLVYVFDRQLDKEEFKALSTALHKKVSHDTVEAIKDSCGKRLDQYFCGTGRNAEVYKSYNIYSISDIEGYNEALAELIENKKEVDSLNYDKQMLLDMKHKGYKKFMQKYHSKYKYFYQSEICWNENEVYRLVDENFYYLYFSWNRKFKDGEGRRRKLTAYAKIRRLIKPSVTPSELLFNLYIDRERFFDNSDKQLSITCLKNRVHAAFECSIEEIKAEYDEGREYAKLVKGDKYRAKKIVLNPDFLKTQLIINKLGVGEKVQSIINKAVKEANYTTIDEYYNSELSVAENLKILQDNGVKVCRRSLYNYCADRGICTRDNNEEKIINLLDVSLSVRKNLEVVKANGIKVGDKKIQKLLKELKSEANESKCSETVKTIESGSYCPTDRVEYLEQRYDDTNTDIEYNNSIIYKECTNDYTSQNDIIDDMEVYLMSLESTLNTVHSSNELGTMEINNETEEDMELNLKTPSKLREQRNVGDIAEEEREFNNDNNEQGNNTNTDDIRGWKFDFGVFGRSNSQSI
ncbi:hypothetical protein [Prevotella pallens]|uniref:hypothetical protein n=1 Tax=Prevotella pallens TaxID=60133 RepID=UPI0028DC1140|nr:hypothetical protein [Prevotella pallens]